jgi:PAS domain S-box-containing protein
MPKSALAIRDSPSSDAFDLSYDSLFAATMDPTVIVDASDGSIVTANVAAARLCGVPRNALAGMPLPTMLEARGPAKLRAALQTARTEGAASLETVRFRGTTLDLRARLSLVRAGNANYVLAHLIPARNEAAVPEQLRGCSLVYDAIDSGAAVLVITDADFNLLYANRAFLRLIEVNALRAVCGRPLSQWLELSQQDLGRMQSQLAARETASAVSVRLRAGQHGRPVLQALAIAVPDGGQSMWAFSMRERSRFH